MFSRYIRTRNQEEIKLKNQKLNKLNIVLNVSYNFKKGGIMKKILTCGLVMSLVVTGMFTFGAFSTTSWKPVNWNKQYLYLGNDKTAYLKYYFEDEGAYDSINAYYSSGKNKTVARAGTKDAGGQVVNGHWASASSSYPNTSKATQGAQRGTDYARAEVK